MTVLKLGHQIRKEFLFILIIIKYKSPYNANKSTIRLNCNKIISGKENYLLLLLIQLYYKVNYGKNKSK